MEPRTDHDILIRVEGKVENLTDEMRLLRDGTKDNIKELQDKKVDKETFKTLVELVTNQGRQIETLKRLVYIGVGGVIVIQFFISVFHT